MTRQIKSKPLFRSFELDRAGIDEENRTVRLAFSSEEPVERFFGLEVLDHEPSSVRLDRLHNKAPVLVDHDPGQHVGVVEDARISTDRRGRALVRFGRSARADEVFRDVLDGIKTAVSVGYRIHKMEEQDDGRTMRATDWEPFEVSVVAVPADPGVGIGRHADDAENTISISERTMSDDTKTTATETRAADRPQTAGEKSAFEVDLANHAAEEGRKQERERVNHIRILGDRHACQNLAGEFIANGRSVDDFREAIFEQRGKAPKVTPMQSADIGLTDKEAESFSFVRAIRALMNPNDPRATQAAAFEFECSRASCEKAGLDSRGIRVPTDHRGAMVQPGPSATGYVDTSRFRVPSDVLKRDLSVGTTTAGGHLVSTDLLSGSFIDILRNATVVSGIGATFLTDLNGNVAIPRKTSTINSYWLATEGGAVTEGNLALDQVTLTPKTVGAFQDYTRQLMLQSSLSVEQLVREDIAGSLAVAIDLAALYGTGSSGQPTGVSLQTDVTAPGTFAAATPTWAEVLSLPGAVATDNALMGTMAYIVNPTDAHTLMSVSKDSGSGQFVYEGGQIAGYPAPFTNQVTLGDYFFGNWRDLLIGMWGGLDLLVDPYTASNTGTVRVVGLQSMDIAVRHGQSFAFENDTV